MIPVNMFGEIYNIEGVLLVFYLWKCLHGFHSEARHRMKGAIRQTVHL